MGLQIAFFFFIAIFGSVHGQVQFSANATEWILKGNTVTFNCTYVGTVGRAILKGGATSLLDASFVVVNDTLTAVTSAVYAPGYSARLHAHLQINLKTVLFTLSNITASDGQSYSCSVSSGVWDINNPNSTTASSNSLVLRTASLPTLPSVSIYNPTLGQNFATANYPLQITCQSNVGYPYTSVSSPGLAVVIGEMQIPLVNLIPIANSDGSYSLTGVFTAAASSITAQLNRQTLSCQAINDYIVKSNRAPVTTQQQLNVKYSVNQIGLLHNNLPAFVDTASVTTVPVIGNDVVQCQANGEPQSTYNWTRVSGSISFLPDSHAGAMVVPDGLMSKTVAYTCTATNTVNNVPTALSFTVAFSVNPSPAWLANQANQPVESYGAASSVAPYGFTYLFHSVALLLASLVLRMF